MVEATIKDVKDFFDIPISQFSKEWKALSEEEKAQIREGISNGSLTY